MMFLMNYLKFPHFEHNCTFFGSVEAWAVLEAFKKSKQIQRNKTMDNMGVFFLTALQISSINACMNFHLKVNLQCCVENWPYITLSFPASLLRVPLLKLPKDTAAEVAALNKVRIFKTSTGVVIITLFRLEETFNIITSKH